MRLIHQIFKCYTIFHSLSSTLGILKSKDLSAAILVLSKKFANDWTMCK
jgi:hypothetical protein